MFFCSHLLLTFFPSLLYTQHHVLTETHRVVSTFVDLSKRKTEISQGSKYSDPLLWRSGVVNFFWSSLRYFTPSFPVPVHFRSSPAVWVYWLDLIRKATHLWPAVRQNSPQWKWESSGQRNWYYTFQFFFFNESAQMSTILCFSTNMGCCVYVNKEKIT